MQPIVGLDDKIERLEAQLAAQTTTVNTRAVAINDRLREQVEVGAAGDPCTCSGRGLPSELRAHEVGCDLGPPPIERWLRRRTHTPKVPE